MNDLPDFSTPKFKANPHPYFARLRAEAPVLRIKAPDGKPAWLLSRYADVAAALKDERFSKNPWKTLTKEEQKQQLMWTPQFVMPLTHNMLDKDPPDHTRLRGLVHQAFTPKYIEQLRARLETLCQSLLDRVEGEERLDLVDALALPLPLTVIADMLALPEGDRRRFSRWSQRIVSVASTFGMVRALPALLLFMRYVRGLIAQRRRAPGADLLSSLVRAEEGGERLSDDELLAMVFLLLIAGHETTVSLISSGMLALLQHPDQLERLRADRSLMKPAIEELLRFTSPVEFATERFTKETLSYSGVTIPAHERVFLIIGSANHDETQFERPDVLDLSRTPNRHVAFGLGAHYCLGAPLARLEAEIAFNAVLDRWPSFSLDGTVPQLKWRRGILFRGVERLPLRITPRGIRAAA